MGKHPNPGPDGWAGHSADTQEPIDPSKHNHRMMRGVISALLDADVAAGLYPYNLPGGTWIPATNVAVSSSLGNTGLAHGVTDRHQYMSTEIAAMVDDRQMLHYTH